MKISNDKIMILFILLSLTIESFGQGYAKVKVIDNQERTDEVIIGKGGMIGIDTNFGEINLFGIPTDTLEIRAIQRTNMTCFFDYAENIDLKIDHRTVCATLPMYSNFIFEVAAHDYPVYVILEEEEGFFCGYDVYYMKDSSNCQILESGANPEPGDTIFILDGIKPNRFTIYPEVILTTQTIEKNIDVVIFPNPTSHKVSITKSADNFKIKKLLIYNSIGQILKEIIPNGENSWSYLFSNKGIYFILIDTDDKTIAKKVLVH